MFTVLIIAIRESHRTEIYGIFCPNCEKIIPESHVYYGDEVSENCAFVCNLGCGTYFICPTSFNSSKNTIGDILQNRLNKNSCSVLLVNGKLLEKYKKLSVYFLDELDDILTLRYYRVNIISITNLSKKYTYNRKLENFVESILIENKKFNKLSGVEQYNEKMRNVREFDKLEIPVHNLTDVVETHNINYTNEMLCFEGLCSKCRENYHGHIKLLKD